MVVERQRNLGLLSPQCALIKAYPCDDKNNYISYPCALIHHTVMLNSISMLQDDYNYSKTTENRHYSKTESSCSASKLNYVSIESLLCYIKTHYDIL